MRFFVICLIAILLFVMPIAEAAELHVGSGYPYAGLWDAWDDCSSNDEIIIHSGTYGPRSGKKNFVLHTNWSNTDPARQNVYIHSAGDGRAILQGQLKIASTPAGTTSITFEGLYIDTSYPGTSYNRSAFYLNAHTGETLGSITIRNCVVYNTGSYNDNGLVYIYGDGTHQQHLVEKCTQVNLSGAYQTGKGIYDCASITYTPSTRPVLRNLIIWSNDVGVRSTQVSTGPTVDYSDVGDSNSYNFWDSEQIGPNTIQDVDPMFYSTNPADPYFLYLSPSTPSSVLAGAHDGTYMGALPVYSPGPPECGDWGYYPVDLNKDCYVNFIDLVTFVNEWLDCTDLTNPDCN